MKNVFIKTGDNEDGFFKRGKKLARLADAGKQLPRECVISFEDPADLFKLLTETRMEVFRTIKEHPVDLWYRRSPASGSLCG